MPKFLPKIICQRTIGKDTLSRRYEAFCQSHKLLDKQLLKSSVNFCAIKLNTRKSLCVPQISPQFPLIFHDKHKSFYVFLAFTA